MCVARASAGGDHVAITQVDSRFGDKEFGVVIRVRLVRITYIWHVCDPRECMVRSR